MVSHNEAGRRHAQRARDRPLYSANTGAGANNVGAPTNSRRSTGYLGRNGRHAESGRRNPAPGYDHATVSRPQNDRHTASLQGFKNHGNQNASRGLLLLAADTSTDAVHDEASLEPDNNASTTPISRRMANSSPISQPIPFSGSRLKRLLPESQRPPSPMTPPGHEPPASITLSPTPIRMFNRPKGKAVEDEYVLPSPVGSNITVAKRGSQKKRSKYQGGGGGGDEAAAKRKFSNPKMINVVSGRPPPRQRQKPVSERPILRMSGDREARYM